MTRLISPPPELVQEWINEEDGLTAGHIANRAAQWGADMELETCCAVVRTVYGKLMADWLRSMRRPKTPSLKEQALDALDMHFAAIGEGQCYQPAHKDTIRRALEQLDD
jgi:hypothetical protein